MAKKKKRKDENVEPKGYIIELKGIFLVLIAIIGLCPFGIVAEFIKGFSCFLFGALWALFLVIIGVIGVYIIIKRKIPKIVNGKTIGIFVILIGVLTLLHMSYIDKDIMDPNKFLILKDGLTVLKTTVDNVMKYINESIGSADTGGGIIGAIFISAFTALLTKKGALFICIALIVCGLIIYTGLSIFEMLKKTGDEVKKVAGKVKITKKDKHTKSDDEDVEDVSDFESILDVCSFAFPQLRLKWHYRSRYEQLIAFSNKSFYDNSLVTFPSPVTDKKWIGIDYHFADGVFDRSTRTNFIEAERVVDLIYENIERFPERSLGVVAFSISQQDLIDRLLSIK